VIVHATAGGGLEVGAELAVTVNVSGLGPVAPVSVTLAAEAPPGQLTAAVIVEPLGAWVTVTCCDEGTCVKLIGVDAGLVIVTAPNTLKVVVGST
jgi:hypothetical protein